jgi:hypothetical protein
LIDKVDVLLAGKDITRFCDIGAFASVMLDPNHTLPAQILGRLQAHHYGALLRYIRQTIGQLSFTQIVLSAGHRGDANAAAAEGGMEAPPYEGQDKTAPRCDVWMVCGRSGSGKTRRVHDMARALGVESVHRFVVHEGFSAELVTEKLSYLWDGHSEEATEDRIIALHFDVTEYVNMGQFQRFLHYFLSLGLLIDEGSGKSGFIKPGLTVKVFVEMPCIKQYLDGPEQQEPTMWPPTDDNWNASHHPLVAELPVLATVIPPQNFVKISDDCPFIRGEKASLVARFLIAAEKQGPMFGIGADTLPAPGDVNTGCTDEQLDAALTSMADTYFRGSSKRVLSQAIELLYERCLYIGRIQKEVRKEGRGRINEFKAMSRFCNQGAIEGMFRVFLMEVQDITSESGDMSDTAIFTIRPQWQRQYGELPVEALYDVVVATHDVRSDRCQETMLYCQHQNVKVLNLEAGFIDTTLRPTIAPAFGMRDTSRMLSTLTDCGHLFTPDSLVRIMHMHSRRSIGASVIYEGQTGCGENYAYILSSFNMSYTCVDHRQESKFAAVFASD